MTKPKNSKKLETRKERRYLRTALTKDELLTAGKIAADKLAEVRMLEGDFPRVKSDFKAKIDSANAELAQQSNKVATGYEYRNIMCTLFLCDPEPGKKRVVRDDTDEQVGVEDMTNDELQRQLELEAEAATKDGDQGQDKI